jgi:hypothetical protein
VTKSFESLFNIVALGLFLEFPSCDAYARDYYADLTDSQTDVDAPTVTDTQSADGGDEVVADAVDVEDAIDASGAADASDTSDAMEDSPTVLADGGDVTLCTISDDFNSTTVPSFWTPAPQGSPPFAPVRTGADLEITIPGVPGPATPANVSNGYQVRVPFNMTNGEVVVQLVHAPTGGNSIAFITVGDASNAIAMGVSGAILGMIIEPSGDLVSVPYDPVAHQWLRIRPDGPSTVWEASADGVNWTEMRRATTAINFATVGTSIFAGMTMTDPTPPGTAVFDNFHASHTCP